MQLDPLGRGCCPGRFLPRAFEVQRQPCAPAPVQVQAGAEAVGAVRAIREHRAGIGGQEAGAEGCEAIADFRVEAGGGLPGPEAVHAP